MNLKFKRGELEFELTCEIGELQQIFGELRRGLLIDTVVGETERPVQTVSMVAEPIQKPPAQQNLDPLAVRVIAVAPEQKLQRGDRRVAVYDYIRSMGTVSPQMIFNYFRAQFPSYAACYQFMSGCLQQGDLIKVGHGYYKINDAVRVAEEVSGAPVGAPG